MKNVTITLDDQVIRWAKLEAAKENKSLSRYIGDMLQGQLQEAQAYQRSMQGWLAQKPFIPVEPGEKHPTREEIYAERSRIR